MITLDELFGQDQFQEMLDGGYIRRQTGHNGELSILNYSEKAQFDRVWNDVTLNCRGLIYHTESRVVVARGFKKFFNWDDASQPFPPTGPCLRMPKMDGSLGILYPVETGLEWTGWEIATRGSFESDQAKWATAKLARMIEDLEADPRQFRTDRSYLFEIIYPENRIVVNYGAEERLVLLDVLETDTGKSDLAEFDTLWWSDKVVKVPMPGFKDTMASDIPQGEEGFVFYWPQKDFRVKMKAAEYIELHRMIFGMNARTVWERLGNGETAEDIAVQLPDEFHQWVRDIADGLSQQATRIFQDAHAAFDEIIRTNAGSGETLSRKDFARMAANYPTRPYLFMIYDDKPIGEAIWKTLRPSGGITMSAISEDVA